MVGSAEGVGGAGSVRCVPEEVLASCDQGDHQGDLDDLDDLGDHQDDPGGLGVAASP